MIVEQIRGEPSRFLVQSASRPDMKHLVDLDWRERPQDKPKAVCSCEENFAKGNLCKHLSAVAAFVNAQSQPA